MFVQKKLVHSAAEHFVSAITHDTYSSIKTNPIPNSIAGRTKRICGPHAARVFETPDIDHRALD